MCSILLRLTCKGKQIYLSDRYTREKKLTFRMDSIRTPYFPLLSITERKAAFVALGHTLATLPTDLFATWQAQAEGKNGWFTPASTEAAISGISLMLQEDELSQWLSHYTFIPQESNIPQESKKIGVVMAGNIPAVGFHDFLCVLLSGHTLLAKLSSQDTVLIKHIAHLLTTIEPGLAPQIHFVERLNDTDATIATGSDNSARYFHYYFGKKPHIIRQNRTSCAILNGQETTEELQALGNDLFQYYGLGCRNVSKLYVPEGYDFRILLDALEPLGVGLTYYKYANNYDYHKSILLINQVAHYDNGFLLVTPSEALASPMSVLHYEPYTSTDTLTQKLTSHADKIQCIVSQNGWYAGSISFGKTQSPHVWDYADGVDTMQFLLELA